jgi:hypothetical protein
MWNLKFRIAAATVLIICAAGLLMYAHSKGKQSGMLQVQSQWDQERLATAQAHADELAKAAQRQQSLQTQVDQLREVHRREINSINRRHQSIVDGLRDRPQARAGASGVPNPASVGVGCTGAGLSRPDAEFLIGLAADAARTQAALNQCRAAYQSLR